MKAKILQSINDFWDNYSRHIRVVILRYSIILLALYGATQLYKNIDITYGQPQQVACVQEAKVQYANFNQLMDEIDRMEVAQ